jgi:DNA polymerase-3 subunit gamma/tau
MTQELYKRYRPRTFKTFAGQDAAASQLRQFVESNSVPHTLLLCGPSGCGKTTVARILKRDLKCGDADFHELNCADFKGIDMVREIRRNACLAPMDGECRIWLIDEAHKLTNDAQNAFLKLLEDTPDHVYFMLATTDDQKLLKTIRTRATEIRLTLIAPAAMELILKRVIAKESLCISEDVLTEIVDASEGSARKALVILGQIGYLKTEQEQLLAVQKASASKAQAITLARLLINPRSRWPEVASVLKSLDDEPESVRYLVLGYCRSVLLGNSNLSGRAFKIIDIFSGNFYDSKHAGLAAACWEVMMVK